MASGFKHFCGGRVPCFAHPSERRLAEILDAAGLPWDYEPHEFTLERDGRGRVTRAFRPDFFLPLADMYIELTTRRPRDVAPKRRKVREAEARHGVLIVLCERSRFESLCRRYPGTEPAAA
jgi:hypothetical protein